MYGAVVALGTFCAEERNLNVILILPLSLTLTHSRTQVGLNPNATRSSPN
jgi:hypothetical protein